MYFNKEFIKSIIEEAQILNDNILNSKEGFSIDSRTIKKDQIFIALKGSKSDGHDFIKEAINKGASGIIINLDKKDIVKTIEKSKLKKLSIIALPNTYDSLLKLAKEWRNRFEYPVIGITGSIGKTSTKEYLANILKLNNTSFIASYKNQNTAIGLSLNILRMSSEHSAAIFEMGISRQGEMELMASIVKPTIAIITYIGHSHMEGLGSLIDIANEKRAIFKYFKETNIGIINGDQDILSDISYMHPVIRFGFKTINQIQARKVQFASGKINFNLKIYKDSYKVSINNNNIACINNLLAATSIAYLLNIPNDIIIKAIEEPVCIPGRFESLTIKNKIKVINDCYNASPESMKAAIATFEKMDATGKKIAVLGDMLELGVNSPFWHRQIGRFLKKAPSISHIILVGSLVKWTKSTLPLNCSYEHVKNWEEALKAIDKLKKLSKNDIILLKASQGMALNNIITKLS